MTALAADRTFLLDHPPDTQPHQTKASANG
jgi:hypothetical protein